MAVEKNSSEIRVSPQLRALKESGGARGIRIEGHVGLAEGDRLRVHPALNAGLYLEISRCSVLHAEEGREEGLYVFTLDARSSVKEVREGSAEGLGPGGGGRSFFVDGLWCMKAAVLLGKAQALLDFCRANGCRPGQIKDLENLISELHDIRYGHCNVPYSPVVLED